MFGKTIATYILNFCNHTLGFLGIRHRHITPLYDIKIKILSLIILEMGSAGITFYFLLALGNLVFPVSRKTRLYVLKHVT